MSDDLETDNRFDEEILELIPHRPPMLLINHLLKVNSNQASAIVIIDKDTPFFQQVLGVPSWIGLEYMGQTAALIAGVQIRDGSIDAHLGFLIGSRQFKASDEYFKPNCQLLVNCVEVALVGESLATFDCTIHDNNTKIELAQANLSVFRKASTKN